MTAGPSVLVAGSTSFLGPGVDSLEQVGFRVVGVAVAPRLDDRSRVWARGHPAFGPEDIAAGLPVPVARQRPQVLVSFLYLRLLPMALIRQFELAVNFHPGPLPEMRGIHVFEAAILEGLAGYRVTCHHLSERFDEGDIVASAPVELGPTDTAGALYRRAMKANLGLLRTVGRDIVESGDLTLPGHPQGAGLDVTAAYLRVAGHPDAADSDEVLDRKLRAACWDGRTASFGDARFPMGPAGVAALRAHVDRARSLSSMQEGPWP